MRSSILEPVDGCGKKLSVVWLEFAKNADGRLLIDVICSRPPSTIILGRWRWCWFHFIFFSALFSVLFRSASRAAIASGQLCASVGYDVHRISQTHLSVDANSKSHSDVLTLV